jgi:hypothetical protein
MLSARASQLPVHFPMAIQRETSRASAQISLPVVSVLMLAYNHGLYIRRAIESILAQKTTFPFELIIGEDCSPDNTRSIVFEFQKKHPDIVRVITSDQNVGAEANSRRVEAAGRSTYVAYCEGDDYWHDPNKLQQQIAFLEADSDYALVHSDFRTAHAATGTVTPRSLGLRDKLDDANAFNDILSGRRIVMTLTACVRRSVLDAVLRECPECYDPRFLMGDTQRWLEIARRGKLKYFPDVWATHQLIPESATQSKDPRKILRFGLSAKDVLDHYIAKYGCPPETKSAAVVRSAIQLLDCAYAAGDTQVANEMLAEYRKLEIPIPLKAWLLAFGTHNRRRQVIVKPAIRALDICCKIQRRLMPTN